MAEEVVIALASYLTEGELILTVAEAAAIVSAVTVVAATIYSARAQRAAQSEARDAYNAALRDRYIMTRGASEPRQIVMGRCRVSGPMFFVGSYGASREHLMFTVALAAHEIDAIEQVYFDDRLVILDGSGNVTGITSKETFSISTSGAAFTVNDTPATGTVTAQAVYGTTIVALGVSVLGKVVTVTGATAGVTGNCEIFYQPNPSPFNPNPSVSVLETIALDASGNGTLTLAHPPISGSVHITDGAGVSWTDLTPYISSIVGSLVTVTGSPVVSITASVQYQYTDLTSRARVRKYLGAPGQAADAAMITNFPGTWTSAHTASGVAYLAVELDYDPTAFPSGLPNISALVRGAKLYDPRTGLTAWSENLALQMRYFALSPFGGRLPAGTVNDTSVIAAANVCDTSSNYVVNGSTYTRALYKGGIVTKSTGRPQDPLNDLAQGMGGKWAFVDGQLRIKAGSFTTPVMTLDETWLHEGQPVHVQAHRARTDVFNVVTATFSDERQNYQVVPMARIAPPAYITEDGTELPLDITLPAVQFSGQAQHVTGIQLRDARASIQLTVLCNMKAYPLELFDVIYVTLSRFGWVNKTFEVQDISWTLSGGIQLSLKETDATVYALGAAFTAFDAGKATRLPSPFSVADIAGLTITSGSGVMATQSDGTVLQRMLATWTAATDPGILDSNGGVEIRYGLANLPDTQWTSVFADGTMTKAYLPDVQFDKIYAIKARGFNAISTGKWCALVVHKVGGVSLLAPTTSLAPSAATEIVSSNPADGTTSVGGSFSGSPTTTEVTIATASYTNTTAASVSVEVSWSMSAVLDAALGLGWVGPNYRLTGSGSGWPGTRTPVAIDIGTASSTQITGASYGGSFTATVAAAGTLTVNLVINTFCGGSGAAPARTVTYKDTALRLTAIKR